jgi:outer membrane protein assembly factor BamB
MSRLGILVFAAVLALLAAGDATASGVDWPQYGFDAAHSSYNDVEGTLSRANVSTLAFAWGAVVGQQGPSAPIVADGALYTVAGGSLVAFDASTGANRFSVLNCGGIGDVQPAFLDHEVIVADPGGELAAYKPATGAQLWCDDVSGSVTTAPAVTNGFVYDTNGSALQETSQSGSGGWDFTPSDFAPLTNSPAVSNGTVYATGGDTIFAVRASDGTLLWRRTLEGDLSAPSVNAPGTTVYVGGDSLFALNAKTGATRWSASSVGVNVSTPAVANGKVYVNSQDPQFGLWAFSATTGAFLWHKADPGEALSTPTIANGVVYDISEFGKLMMFNSSNGALLGKLSDPGGRRLRHDIGAQAAVVNGMVYAATAGTRGLPDRIDAFQLP